MTFRARDLEALDVLLGEARAVVSMRDIFDGIADPEIVGLRHDVDDNPGSLETAVKLARWEAERGYRSTFFVLHTASYWETLRLPSALAEIAACGHEIGLHANAIAEALRTGEDADELLDRALRRLRVLGHQIAGVAAHGDPLCGMAGFVNDEQFAECARPEMGDAYREITFDARRVRLDPKPLSTFGLLYDTHRLPHGRYLSDSGGSWNEPFPGAGVGQLHILMHPDWWSEAFSTTKEVLSV